MTQFWEMQREPADDRVSSSGLPPQGDFIERDRTDPSQHWGSALIRPDRTELLQRMNLQSLRTLIDRTVIH